MRNYYKNNSNYRSYLGAWCKDYYSKNKEVWKTRKKMPLEKRREYQRKWRLKNIDIARERSKIYAKQMRSANPKRVRDINEAYWKRNPEKLKLKRKVSHARRRASKMGAFQDGSANIFIKWVRSQEFINCAYCGKQISGNDAHIDHVLALSKGGSHASSNLTASCPPCNRSKGNKNLEEWIKTKFGQQNLI